MKKTAFITSAMTLLVVTIMVIASAGSTNANGNTAVLESPTEILAKADAKYEENAMAETMAEKTATECIETKTSSINAGSDEAQSKTASETLRLPTVAPTLMNAVPASSSTTKAVTQAVKPIAPAVLPSATASQTTTTTRYVPPQAAAATNAQPPASTTILYTKGNYEWVGTPQATTTTTRTTTSTTQYVPPVTTTTRPTTTTTTTTRATTTSSTAPAVTQAKPDYEAMGQATYQDELIKGLNALRAERGLPPMTVNATLMANSLAHAQKMAAAGSDFHTTENMPGCESVCRVPTNFPAKLLGETLGKHSSQFLEACRSSVGIAVIRQGNYLYAVMQGN